MDFIFESSLYRFRKRAHVCHRDSICATRKQLCAPRADVLGWRGRPSDRASQVIRPVQGTSPRDGASNSVSMPRGLNAGDIDAGFP